MEHALPGRSIAWRKIAIIVCGLVLAGLVVRSGLGHGLSATAPLLAARIDGGNGMALGAASDRLLKTAQTEDAVTSVRDLSRRALLASPMEAAALRNLGFLTAIRDGEDKADKQLSLAGRLSKRDYFTHAWLLDRRFRQGRVEDAVAEADIVLRQRESAWAVIVPELVKISGDPRILKPMTQALKRKPVWRSTYLIALGQKGADRDAVYAQFRLLRGSDAPPEVDELRSYLSRTDLGRSPERLWSDWLALTPGSDPRVMLREGSFETLAMPPPFAWSLFPGDGVYAELSPSPEGPGKALYVSYEGTREVGFTQQSLKLPPGSYQLKGRVYSDESVKPDQIAIFLGCGSYSSATELAKLLLKPTPGRWDKLSLTFTVKPDCRLQQLRINGELGDFRTRAAVWIDDLAIAPVATPRDQVKARASGSADRPKTAIKTP